MKNYVAFEAFIDRNDAYDWMDKELNRLPPGWKVHEASIRHLNGGWATSVFFNEVVEGDIDS